jgi:hypothetical protein
VYNLAAFTSSFLYFNIEVGTVATGVVIAGIVAYEGGDGGLRGKVSQDIGKVVVGVLLGIN